MAQSADVVVIGGGINGAATAHYLMINGAGRVVVLAGTREPEHSASRRSVGLLRTHHDNVPETQLAAASLPVLAEWRENFGTTNGWLNSGFLRFVGADEVDTLKANAAIQEKLGIRFDILEPEALRLMYPAFDVSGVGAALLEPDAGTADAWLCTVGLLDAAKKDGAHVLPLDATQVLQDTYGVSGVLTSAGEAIACRTVVLAAGAWSGRLARTVDLLLPLEPRVITVAELVLPEKLRGLPSYLDPVSDSWVTPRADGSALLNVRADRTGSVVDPDDRLPAVPATCYGEGLGRVVERLPELAGTRLDRAWHSVDTYAPDGKPIIGPVDAVPGLFLNVAGAGKGHKVAPAIGQSLAELVLGSGEPRVDLTPFAVSRFDGVGFPVSGTPYRRKTIG